MDHSNLRFHPQAEEEVQLAYRWYRSRSPNAARAFRADLDHAVRRVTEAPERHPLYHGRARRYIFQKCPFSLIYHVTDETIDVIATGSGFLSGMFQ